MSLFSSKPHTNPGEKNPPLLTLLQMEAKDSVKATQPLAGRAKFKARSVKVSQQEVFRVLPCTRHCARPWGAPDRASVWGGQACMRAS